jgi:hypothetical protein
MATPELPAWLTGILVPAAGVVGAFAKSLLARWRSRHQTVAEAEAAEASVADTLVGTALRLVEQLQLELESMRERLAQCQAERRLQEEVLVGLREIVARLTEERDAMRNLLDQATRPR